MLGFSAFNSQAFFECCRKNWNALIVQNIKARPGYQWSIDSNGMHFYHYIFQNGNIDVLQSIFGNFTYQQKIDTIRKIKTLENKQNQTPFDLAKANSHHTLLAYIDEIQRPAEKLIAYTTCGNDQAILELLSTNPELQWLKDESGNTIYHKLCGQGRLDLLTSLFEHLHMGNEQNAALKISSLLNLEQQTPLQRASKYRHNDVIELFDRYFQYDTYQAAQSFYAHDHKNVHELVQKNPNIFWAKDDNGIPFCFKLVHNGQLELFEALFKTLGPEHTPLLKTVTDRFGNTIFHIAGINGHFLFLQNLNRISYADPVISPSIQVMMTAENYTHLDTTIRNDAQEGVLFSIAKYKINPVYQDIVLLRNKLIEFYILQNQSPRHRNSDGQTLLHIAILNKDLSLFLLLYQRNDANIIDIQAQDVNGDNILHYAFRHQDEHFIEMLKQNVAHDIYSQLLETHNKDNKLPNFAHTNARRANNEELTAQKLLFQYPAIYDVHVGPTSSRASAGLPALTTTKQ